MLNRGLLLTVFSISLLACVTVPPETQPFSSKPQHIQLDGFSIVIPTEPGWFTARRNSASIHLVQPGDESGEFHAIQAWQVDLPLFNSDEAFSSYVVQNIEKDRNGKRFTAIETEVSTVRTRHGVCVRVRSIQLDKLAAKQVNNLRPALLEIESLTCRSPEFRFQGAYLALSNRYHEGNRDTSLPGKANSFFSSLAFDKSMNINAI